MSFFLDEARSKAEAEGLNVEWVQADMRDFVCPRTFDGAWNVFTSFGYFADERDDARVAVNIHQSLLPGGRFLLGLVNPVTARKNSGKAMEMEVDGITVIDRPTVMPAGRTTQFEWTLKRDEDTRIVRATLRLYGPKEIEELLRGAGFSSIRIFGGFDERPYGPETRLVVVAEK